MITSAELAERMKAEIIEDVRDGIVPATVASFSELHDYVDANCYGGTEQLLDDLHDVAPDTDEGHAAALSTLCDVANPAMDEVDAWIKKGGITDALREPAPFRTRARSRDDCFRVALVEIDKLIAVEGDEPALNRRHSLNQLLTGVLSDAQKGYISKDLATIEYWRGVYASFVGREQELVDREDTLISVWEPAIDGHRIADGFHRLVAAKLAGLRAIGARLAPMFRQH